MEWIEITGRSLEDAKDKALDVLGVDERDAEFEILAEPKGGLFGKKEARIRARILPRTPRAKTRRDQGGARRQTRERTSTPRSGSRGRQSQTVRKEPRMEKTEEQQESGETYSRPPREEVIVALDEQSKIATDFLSGFVSAVGVAADVSAVANEEDQIVNVRLDGSDLGLFIGPRGQTMTSLQEFLRIVVQRRTGATNGRIILDVSGYRERRKEALSKFARDVAQEVLESGSAKVLEPMNPADRKIVHDTVNEIEGVATSSEGMEPRRRVVISPAAVDAESRDQDDATVS
jgi:spoIIIJ-associated protein